MQKDQTLHVNYQVGELTTDQLDLEKMTLEC